MLPLASVLTTHHAHLFEGIDTDVDVLLSHIAPIDAFAGCELSCDRHGTFSIDESRALAARHREKAPDGVKKVFVIFAEMITPPAQHALLKVLEEPVPDTFFFIVTPRTDALLETLKSRSLLHRMPRAEGSATDALSFVDAPLPERLAMIKQLASEHEDEDETSRLATAALMFVRGIESVLHARTAQQGREALAPALAACLLAETHLARKGASAKMLLENIALSLN